MSVNPLHCQLSSWNGEDTNCRWCNSSLGEFRKRWCCGSCLEAWRLQHRYFLARQLAVKLSKHKCLCIRSENEPRHACCNICGLCESVIKLKGNILTCDHIIPRRGDRSRFSCNHHQSNLQILCSDCHEIKTRSDEQMYGV
jgi:5-methylcytosine-specific restriction endonuclease McrA